MNRPDLYVSRSFSINANVAAFHCANGVVRLIHLPTGINMVLAPAPRNLAQLTHEFHLEAVKRTGALVG